MSTRCTLHFEWDKDSPGAIVYRHGDGYPGSEHGVLADVGHFFDAVEAQTKDRRYTDPSYLAAKFVVWQADQNTNRHDWKTGERVKHEPLDFLSLGIVREDPGDIEYRYHILCSREFFDNGRPHVSYEKI